jgi:hypothetical protein
MKMRSAVLGAGLLVCSAVQAQAQAVQLRFSPPVGQVTRYRTVNQMWMTGDTSGAALTSTMYSTRTVASMDGPNYVVRTVMDSTVTVMPGAGGGMAGMGGDMTRGMTIVQHMDARGRVLSSEVTPPPSLPPMMADAMRRGGGSNDAKGLTVMPAGAISPGYTWTDSMVTSAGSGRGRPAPVVFTVTYRFERVARERGTRLAIISVHGTQRGGMQGTIAGEMALDLDRGRVARNVMHMTMQTPEAGRTTRLRLTMDILP